MRRTLPVALVLLVACPGAPSPKSINHDPEVTRLSPVVVAADSTPSSEPPPPRPPLPWGTHGGPSAFWDVRSGLIAQGQRVWFSNDGLRTWHLRFRFADPVRSIATFGTGMAWITTTTDEDCPCELFKTTDRGHSWSRAGRTEVAPTQVVTSRTAFASSSRPGVRAPRVLRTTNGGHRWRVLAEPCPAGAGEGISGLSFATPRVGLVACTFTYGVGNEGKAIMRTEDGGRSWTMVAADYSGAHRYIHRGAGLTQGGYVTDVALFADGTGWLTEMIGGVFRTLDFGRTWHRVESPLGDAFGGTFFPDGSALVFGSVVRWVLLRTPDAGHTWRRVHTF